MGQQDKRGLTIAVDGPSGVGKTTVSRLLARRLGLRYADTGAMYRAVALAAHEAGVDLENSDALEKFVSGVTIKYDTSTERVFVGGKDYTGLIRTEFVSGIASMASKNPSVRRVLVECQREIARGGSIVMEGRDIGTVVLPDADLKFFLGASHDVRARRRHLEIKEKETAEAVGRAMLERDRRDREREESPLRKAPDAVPIDTTELAPEDVVEKMLGYIRG